MGLWKGKLEYFGKIISWSSYEGSYPKENFVISEWTKIGLFIDSRKKSQYLQGENLSLFPKKLTEYDICAWGAFEQMRKVP